jgi:hypothetical protein
VQAECVAFAMVITCGTEIVAIASFKYRLLQKRVIVNPIRIFGRNEQILCLNGCCGNGKQQCAESDCCEVFICMSLFHARVYYDLQK